MKCRGGYRLPVFKLGLLLSILMQSGVWGQGRTCTPSSIQATIEQLSLAQNREAQIDELVQCDAKAAPFLVNTFESDDPSVVEGAVQTLVKIGKSAIPTLEAALSSSITPVREYASEALGRIGAEAVPTIRNSLSANDPNVRAAAAEAILSLGSKGDFLLVDLIDRLQREQNARVLEAVVLSVADFGLDAEAAAPALLKLLDRQPLHVRRVVIETLGVIRADAPAVVPALREALKDPNDSIQERAAKALAEYQLEATNALPELVDVFEKSASRDTQKVVIRSMTKIAKANQRFADTLSTADQDGIAQLEQVEQALQRVLALSEGLIGGEIIEELALTHSAIQTKLENLKGDPAYQLLQWFWENPWVWIPITCFVGYLGCFTFRPLWLLRLDEWVPAQTFEVPVLKLKLSMRMLIWLKYHPRVLDAWVKTHRESVAKDFVRGDTVQVRRIHISMPVTLDGEDVSELTPAGLKSTFARTRCRLLIWGEGGAGKTSLACQIAKWSMGEGDAVLCGHALLPVLIEQEMGDDHPLKAAIRNQLPLTPSGNLVSDELLEHLLKKRRVLVIIDHFSEMGNESRDHILNQLAPLSINALIVTSRLKEELNGIPKVELQPMRVQGDRLLGFVYAYLKSQGKRDWLEDEEYFTACRGLTRMVGDRDITLLLARLYADQLIATLEGSTSDLPDNIPDLMLSYLNRLNQGVELLNQLDQRLVHQAAQRAAWQCLKQTYQPKPAVRQGLIEALVRDNEIADEAQRCAEAEKRLSYLEKRLRLIQTIEPGNQIRLTLDPLVEYLAALELVGYCQSAPPDENPWRQFFEAIDERVQNQQVVLNAIQGFLLAVRDCCLLKRNSAAPDSVIETLEQMAGLDPEAQQQARRKRKIQLLISDLSALDEDPERVPQAVKRLGEIGAEAKAAVPALAKLLKENDESLCLAVVDALGAMGRAAVPVLISVISTHDENPEGGLQAVKGLGKIGAEAKAAVPTLARLLKENDESLRLAVVDTLAAMGRAAAPALCELGERIENDESDQVRERSISALERIGTDAQVIIPLLERVVEDGSNQIQLRRSAVHALARFGWGIGLWTNCPRCNWSLKFSQAK